MSELPPNTSLSLPARLFLYLGPPATILFTSLASPRTALLAPITFLPPAIGLKAWYDANRADPAQRAELEPLIWTFASTGTLGIVGVLLGQLAVMTVTARALFPSKEVREYLMTEFGRSTVEGLTSDELVKRVAFASSWRNWVFNASLCYAAAALFEELLKLTPVLYAKRRNQKQKTPKKKTYLDFALAGALSFGISEGIGFLHAAVDGEKQSGAKLALTVAERMIFGFSGHLLTASLTGLRATRRDFYGAKLSWWEVILPSVIMHGTGNFILLSASALEGHVGWVHPTGWRNSLIVLGLITAVNGVSAWLVGKEWKSISNQEGLDKATKSD